MSKSDLDFVFTEIDQMKTEKSYKPMLILSIILEFEKKSLLSKSITLNDSIISNFISFYHEINYLKPNVALPFFHIGISENLWSINWKHGKYTEKQLKSVSQIKRHIENVTINDSFFRVLTTQDARNLLKSKVLNLIAYLVHEKDPKNKRNPNFLYTAPDQVLLKLENVYENLLRK